MIHQNLQLIQQQITEAASKCDRDPGSIKLLAVSKRKPIDSIIKAHKCGQLLFGENYLQEANEKITQLNSQNKVHWHFIGHLQSNKAKLAVNLFDMIETVDRIKIARSLNKFASQQDKTLNILVQVNIGREKQKAGILEETSYQLLKQIQELSNLKVCGLMTIPPNTPQPEDSRIHFRNLRELALKLADHDLFADPDNIELSMGMSGDFKIAIEEGATLVRLGTALFGTRN